MNDHVGPIVTTDSVLLRNHDGVLEALVHTRPREPFAGRQALPGVYVRNGETISAATRRCLSAKGGIDLPASAESRTVEVYDALDRDPRGHALSVVTATFLDPSVSGTADGTSWLPVTPDFDEGLAFDHDAVVRGVLAWLSGHLWTDQFVLRGMLAGLTPTTAELRKAVLPFGVPDNTSNIRRSLVSSGLMRQTETTVSTGRGKPAIVWEWSDRA